MVRDGDRDDPGTLPLDTPTEEVGPIAPADRVSRLDGPGARYQLGAVIGVGGMGEVVSARDTQIGRDVAIKRMRGEHLSSTAMTRFFREASVQGRLDHPAIVPVYELGVDREGRPFFAMKKVAGITLRDMIHRERAPLVRLLRAFVDVCNAVAFAHARGVLHRDLKPSNIVLGEFGEVYVLDWGIAKILGEATGETPVVRAETAPGARGSTEDPDGVTRVGGSIGTPGYTAPEQELDARLVDERADVYSLGCVLFEIVHRVPLHKVESGAAAPRADAPPEIAALLPRATAERLAERLATVDELATAVQRFLDGDRDLALRTRLAEQHLAAARDGERRGDDRAAMREAGRALAMDPKLPGAAELVGGMLVAPAPTALPAEVTAAIEEQDARAATAQIRASRRASLGYLWMLPALIALAPNHPWLVAALVGIPVVNTIFATDRERGMARALRISLTVGLHIAVLAHAFSPFLVAPVFATVVTMSVASSRQSRRGREVVVAAALMLAAVFVPWLLESLRVLDPTIAAVRGTLTLTGAGLDMPGWIQLLFVSLFALVAVAGAGSLGYSMRRAERDIRTQLQLQTWRLRQLFPAHAAEAAAARGSAPDLTVSAPAPG